MATGIVKWFNETKGYGFITTEESPNDIFAHCTEVRIPGTKSLKEGQSVVFEVTDGKKGKQAANIRASE